MTSSSQSWKGGENLEGGENKKGKKCLNIYSQLEWKLLAMKGED